MNNNEIKSPQEKALAIILNGMGINDWQYQDGLVHVFQDVNINHIPPRLNFGIVHGNYTAPKNTNLPLAVIGKINLI
ncbi:hypothetical protein KPA96_13855 [Burkholderia cenocepacia]|uniref:hypothetical protein n=1 Tax=Burkholderia cenocepacia TaxID=95486 RepID=UPI002861F0D5|nr:hypothetical protein [Burkholderia cenocepacia]MDR8076742.1 hypothetical protein [Burkholderia cenocepacia]